ncbi:MAG: YqgE/AlgH family protein [Alphaproteobacteria bacterium]|nr:YqgE/AlgH family protein [Alphaproteobacteria bacterium]
MRPLWFRRAFLLLGMLLAPATFVSAALPPSDATPPPETNPPADSLTGQLLVASPHIPDPRFQHTVILLIAHGREGTVGIIINRPLGEQKLARLLAATGEDAAGVTGSVRVFAGGPVQPEIGFIVHSSEYRRPGTIAIDGQIAVTADPTVLRDLGRGRGPRKSLVAFGYAGWAPGQLEAEMARDDWFTVKEDPALVFDADRAKVWDLATARRTLPL